MSDDGTKLNACQASVINKRALNPLDLGPLDLVIQPSIAILVVAMLEKIIIFGKHFSRSFIVKL